MSGDCLFCGSPAERAHHPTGRDAAERYLDPDFTVAVCHDDHTLAHDDWYSFELESTPRGATVLHLVELGMRRLALFCARLAPVNEVWAGLSTWFGRNAELVGRVIAVLDRDYPGWQRSVGT
jgi:hypothetical protein